MHDFSQVINPACLFCVLMLLLPCSHQQLSGCLLGSNDVQGMTIFMVLMTELLRSKRLNIEVAGLDGVVTQPTTCFGLLIMTVFIYSREQTSRR